MIKSVTHKGTTLAIVIPGDFKEDGIKFYTDDDQAMQMGLMCRPRGHQIIPHRHTPVVREVSDTQEVLFIRKGRVRVDFYDDHDTVAEQVTLQCGDTILLLTGAHGFEMLEDSEIIEAKTGPYLGDRDKVRFDPGAGDENGSPVRSG